MKTRTIFSILLLISIITIGLMFGLPTYNVWQQEMAGKAKLAEAEQSRQIIIKQAKAEYDAAIYQAKAIDIMGKKAKEYPEYRQQEFIAAFGEAIKSKAINQIIYVPTEGNIPITEAIRNSQ